VVDQEGTGQATSDSEVGGARALLGDKPPETPPVDAPPPSDVAANPPIADLPDFAKELPEDLQKLVKTKGWKAVPDALTSYANLQKRLGKAAHEDARFKPGEGASDEEKVDFARWLGIPESPEGYGKLEQPEGVEVPGELLEAAPELFHQAGLTPQQAEKLMEGYSRFLAGSQEKSSEVSKLARETETRKLKEEWGAAYDERVDDADRALAKFGVTDDQLVALADHPLFGLNWAMKHFQALGEPMREARMIAPTGGDLGGGLGLLSPEEASTKLRALEADPEFQAKMARRDPNAKMQRRRLIEMSLSVKPS